MAPKEGDVFAMAEEEANRISSGGSGMIGQVWIGNDNQPFVGPVIDESKRPQTTKKFVSGDKIVGLMDVWYANGNTNYAKVRNNLLKAGLLHPTVANYAPSVMEKTSEAVALWMKSDKSKPFGEWLDGLGQQGPQQQDGSGSRTRGAYSGPVTRTNVSVSADRDVEMTLNSLAVDLLGRNLTKDELQKYTAKYQKQQMQNPTVSTTTPNGRAASSTLTRAGMSNEAMAKDLVMDMPGYAENQVEDKAVDMFLSAIEKGQQVIRD